MDNCLFINLDFMNSFWNSFLFSNFFSPKQTHGLVGGEFHIGICADSRSKIPNFLCHFIGIASCFRVLKSQVPVKFSLEMEVFKK